MDVDEDGTFGNEELVHEIAGDDAKELPSRDASPAIPVPEESDLEATTPTLSLPHVPAKDPDGVQAYLDYCQSLPYTCESLHEMNDRLDLIIRRIIDSIHARDYDIGLLMWSHRLETWLGLKCAMKRSVRAKLAQLYYQLTVLPGIEPRTIELAASMTMMLIESKKRININDLILPWKPLYNLLSKELFPKKRMTGRTAVSSTLLNLAAEVQRFFPPHEADEMLATFLPRLNGTKLDTIIATQAFMIHFLPLSHPTLWLPATFRLWESFNSSVWDEQWFEVYSRLAEMHNDPQISSPRRAANLQHQAESGLSDAVEEEQDPSWHGIRKDVGIFARSEWDFIMCKCLQSMGVPVGSTDRGKTFLSMAGSGNQDHQASQASVTMIKPAEKLVSLATLIVYSISEDAAVSGSGSATPATAIGTTSSSFLGGSKALDSLNKFIQATESFFHPSNAGHWSGLLSKFVQCLSTEFVRRWTDEQKPVCRTPHHWRLTPRIKREFVLTLRTVTLLSLYAKTALTIAEASLTLRNLAVLSSELVIPSVLERAYPSLENVIETHRTNSSLTALSALSTVMVSRTLSPFGGKHIAPLFDLCIPGIDVNDPGKTMTTCLFLVQAVATLGPLDDLTRPEVAALAGRGRGRSVSLLVDGDGSEQPATPIGLDLHMLENASELQQILPRREEDQLLVESTAAIPDWVTKFFRAVFHLLENLPDPGKGGSIGGKVENRMVAAVAAACDAILQVLSPRLFDEALRLFQEQISTSPRSNSAKALGSIAGAFSRANSTKTLATVVPLCTRLIRIEVDNGAASTPSTSTALPMNEDTTLQFYCYVLNGSLGHHSENILPYADQLLDLLSLMKERCRSERGYGHVSRLIASLMTPLCSVWPKEAYPTNPSEYEDPSFLGRSHQNWGKLFEVSDVKIDWHVPSSREIELVIRCLRDFVEPSVSFLEKLVQTGSSSGTEAKIWVNDFNRHCAIVKTVLPAIAPLIEMPSRPTEAGAQVTDAGSTDAAFVDDIPRCKAHYCISDPTDPRYQFVMTLKGRIYELLHVAILRLKDNGADDAIDCVKMIISTIKCLMLDYSIDRGDHGNAKKAYEFAKTITRFSRQQNKHPRFVWVRRAYFYHTSRQRLNSYYRTRSAADDLLVQDLAVLCRSPYVALRKAAQKALNTIIPYFDGVRALLIEDFFASLKEGSDSDAMKGALYVLGMKFFGNFAVLDWRFTPQYIIALLGCQHQEKNSIQSLVKTVCTDFIIRLAEPCTIVGAIDNTALASSAKSLDLLISVSSDLELLKRVEERRKMREDLKDAGAERLAVQLLALAEADTTHWRYKVLALRFMRALIRRDKPLSPKLSQFLAQQLISDLPSIRGHAVPSLTKVLHFAKLRSFAQNDTQILLQNPQNPLKRELTLPRPLPPNFTKDFLASLQQPITAPETKLCDKQTTGWLIWGKTVQVHDPPPAQESPFKWETASANALNAIRGELSQPKWWADLTQHLAQEQSRSYLAADNTILLKSIFQIFEDSFLDLIKPLVEEYLLDSDRHKQRAGAELLAGAVRGSKHWPLSKQDKLSEWLAPLLPAIVKSITPDSQDAVEMLFEYILLNRDPRRNKLIIDFLTTMPIDLESSEAFGEAKKLYLVSMLSRSLSWHFESWTTNYLDRYWQAVDNPFQEIRVAISETLRPISELRLHPSFASVEEFLGYCKAPLGSTGLILDVDQDYRRRIDDFKVRLAHWKSIRQPASSGSQQYDVASLCILFWIWTSSSDIRITAVYPFVTTLLPDLFQMQEILDNAELKETAQSALASIANLSYPITLVRPMMASLTNLLQTSPSWRIRLDVLPVLQVFYFNQLFAIDDDQAKDLLETLCSMLRDPSLEVREAAAASLSGIVRCSQRHAIVHLQKRFLSIVRQNKIPRRRQADGQETAGYHQAILEAHAGVLGAAALINAHPYDVPSWLPALLIEVMGAHISSPAPVSTTVKSCLADFKKSHQDSWVEDQKAFTPEQLSELNDLLLSPSSYLV